jgi:hypothetical protein
VRVVADLQNGRSSRVVEATQELTPIVKCLDKDTIERFGVMGV